jgi:chaperone modulatory protein CbpM
MSARDPFEPLPAVLVDESEWIAVEQLCTLVRLDLDVLAELADLGVFSPRGVERSGWQLPASSLPRLRTAGRLMRDLGVNASGVAVALELIETQRELERRVRELERLLAQRV